MTHFAPGLIGAGLFEQGQHPRKRVVAKKKRQPVRKQQRPPFVAPDVTGILGASGAAVVSIDGSRSAAETHARVLAALDELGPAGTVVLAECNPQIDVGRRWNDRSWRVIAKLRSERPDLSCFVVDGDKGVGIISRRARPGTHQPVPLELDSLDWTQLVARRSQLLGVVPARDWQVRRAAADCTDELELCIPTMKPSLLADCLKRIARTAAGVTRLTVFGNGCSPEVPDEAHRAFRHVRVLTSHENLGIPKALDRMLRRETQAPPLAYFYIHDDVELRDYGWDMKLLSFLAEHPRAAVVGLTGARAYGVKIPADRKFGTLVRRADFRSNMRDWQRYGAHAFAPFRAATVDGLAFAVRPALLAELGGWSWWPYPHHGYDNAVCCEAAARGLEVWCLPLACDHANAGAGTRRLPAYRSWVSRRYGSDDLLFQRVQDELYRRYHHLFPIEA